MQEVIEFKNMMDGLTTAWAVGVTTAGPFLMLAAGTVVHELWAPNLLQRATAAFLILAAGFTPLFGIMLLVLSPTRLSLVEHATQAKYGFISGLAIGAVLLVVLPFARREITAGR